MERMLRDIALATMILRVVNPGMEAVDSKHCATIGVLLLMWFDGSYVATRT